uniref:Helicase ATP-binding domain-containing protein n=1 Tax=Ascaris lumbricoides TaxID=6252 RepID=A0A0M3IFR0_ASCLU
MLRRGALRFGSVGGAIQLQLTTQLSTKALRSKWKRRPKSSSNLAFPPAFTENLRRWQKLLKMEIDANERVIRIPLVEVTTIRSVQQQVLKLTAGVPLVLCSGERISHLGECVLLSASERRIRLKLDGRAPELSVDHPTSYVLIPSVTAGVLHSLTKFLSESSSWKGLPGERILQYAYRAVPMPVVHRDRKLQCIQKLNDDQQRAVAAALNRSRPIVTIQGPPGTGKTAVVIEIILQAIRTKQKNESIRLTGDSSITRKISQEATRLRDSMRKAGLTSVVVEKQVILCTVSSGSLHTLRGLGFFPDVVIVDEAAQAMECATWVPLLQAPRCVLAGDHCQLPTVLHSSEAISQGLGTSLMETLDKEFGSVVKHFLSVQHRMNEKIMRWSADYFYESKLQAHRSVAGISLSDISAIDGSDLMNEPLLMIDTHSVSRQRGLSVSVERIHQQSYRNHGEAEIVCAYVQFLMRMGVRQCDVGVISPYFAQVELLRKTLGEEIVNTVDGFQGQQREVIVMSLVRNNYEGRIGFLSDARRLNVAVTRARRQFLLVGSSSMMRHAEHLRSLLECIRTVGKVLRPNQLTFLSVDAHAIGQDVSER